MKLLLDTCAFIWITTDAPELSARAKELFREPENDVFLSSVSVWEIAVKNSLGRLPLPASPEVFVPFQREQHGIESISLDEESCLQLLRLPKIHQDPFDRMLVCQAIIHSLTILTPDPLVTQYPIRCLW